MRLKKPKIYSRESEREIERQIPKEILEAMSAKGWNALGIYELVQEVLKQEKKKVAPKRGFVRVY